MEHKINNKVNMKLEYIPSVDALKLEHKTIKIISSLISSVKDSQKVDIDINNIGADSVDKIIPLIVSLTAGVDNVLDNELSIDKLLEFIIEFYKYQTFIVDKKAESVLTVDDLDKLKRVSLYDHLKAVFVVMKYNEFSFFKVVGGKLFGKLIKKIDTTDDTNNELGLE